jgi:membrane fusion protein, multidrug efflux system
MSKSDGPSGVSLPESEEKRNSSTISSHSSALRVIAVLGLALGVMACREEPQVEQVIRPVKAIVVQEQSGDVVRSFSGDMRARIESTLGFRVPGKIIERLVNIGDEVKVGQVIARLDENDLILSENSAKAAVLSAKSRLAVARDALTRAEKLLPQGYTPQSIVDQRRLETDAAQAALEAAEAQARQAGNSTGYAELKADKAGIVTRVEAQAGQVVAAGTPVIALAEAGEIEVAFSVPEQDVTQLAIGQDAELEFWADREIRTQGRIREIARQADTGSRTYAVRIAIPNPPAASRLGMTVTATLKLRPGAPHISVPLTALTQINGRSAVYVADRASSIVSARPVETGGVSADSVNVVSGLKAGEVVVTGGVQFLSDGLHVRLPKDIVQTAAADRPAISR